MARVEEFEALRPLLFSIAYRILGSVGEAEDAVQETWIRFATSGATPTSLKSYLSTIVTRVSIDVLRSARARRETYVGPWFPEPLPTDRWRPEPYADPEHAAELADSVSMAALLLLERLSPLERAVFVLREVFQLGFDDVAAAVGRSEAACRQLASRARRHMAEGRPRFEADQRKRAEIADRFFGALLDGDLDGLQDVLAADVKAVNDGAGEFGGSGGTFGAATAARILLATVPPLLDVGAAFERRELNGQPGAILRDRNGDVIGTWTLEIYDGRVQTIHSLTSPHKLGHLGPVGDIRAVAAERARVRKERRRRDRPGRRPGRVAPPT